MADCRTEDKGYKMSLQHLVTSDRKEVLETDGICQKDQVVEWESLALAQSCNNLSIQSDDDN